MNIDCYVTLGNERETVLAAATLITQMDEAGVDKAVIAPSDRQIAVNNREGNDCMIQQASNYPDRLAPACSVNPWFGDVAVKELERAVVAGARMLVLDPTLQGFLINDELPEQVIVAAGRRGLPIYVHTGPHLYGAPWQLVDCAMRFPDFNFIMGHSGSTDYWNDIPYAGKFAPNVYIEASFARPYKYDLHLRAVGADRGIMGSAAPRNHLPFEWAEYRRYFNALENAREYDGVFGDNLARILPLNGGRP